MKNKSLEILFGNIDVLKNGNLLFIARIVISELIQLQKDKVLKDLLNLLNITRDTPLLLRDIDEILQNKSTIFDKDMKKKADGLDNVPYLRPYLALFWQFKTILINYSKDNQIKDDEKNIDLDFIFEKERGKINTSFFNSLPKINFQILHSIILFHFSSLKLKDMEKNKDLKYDNRFYGNNSLTTLRAVEILVNLQFLKNNHINKIYFEDVKEDLIVNFINIANDNKYEKISYFIKEDKDIGNYIHYENKKYNVQFKLNSSRRVLKGENKADEAINQNIVTYLADGLYSYKKLIQLKLKQEKGEPGLNKSSSYEIQATQQEPFFEKTNKSIKRIKIPHEKEELTEINSKPTLSKRVTTTDDEDKEESKTIENPQIDVPNSFKQLKQNRAYSANVTKERLLLSNNYNIPEINLYKEFIKFVANKPFSKTLDEENIYNSIFLISVITGFQFDEILNIFFEKKSKIYQNKTGVVELNLNAEVISNIHDEIFFEKANKKIKYLIPGLFINLIDKIKNELLTNGMLEENIINKDKYKFYIEDKIKRFHKTIYFNLDKTWYFLVSYIRSHLIEDITTLFGLSKNFKSDESKLAYGSTAKDSLIFSKFLLKIYDELELEYVISNLYNWTNFGNKISLNNNATIRVGSNRAINAQKVKDFFSILKNEINNSNDDIDKFNLYSIYTRFALSILLGTRTFNYSCSLDRVSFSFHILSISEKSNTLIAGIRLIPLCNQAENIIKEYLEKSTRLNIPKDTIYFKNSYKTYSLYNTDEAKNILKNLNVNKYLIDFIDNVPTNIGRHIISKYAIENNLNGYYLETFLGHYVSGAEQFGTFSNLNFKEYVKTMREFLNQIAEIYGIY